MRKRLVFLLTLCAALLCMALAITMRVPAATVPVRV